MTKLDSDLAPHVADVASAYFANNSVARDDIQTVIGHIAIALGAKTVDVPVDGPVAEVSEPQTPQAIKKSITPDALISFIDGKPYKSLKRHLTANGTDPDKYRARYGLSKDYPMVCASYSAERSALAQANGLGANRKKAAAPAADASDDPTA